MWNRREWFLAGATAVGMFGMTLGSFWATPLTAGDEQPGTVEVATPTYVAGACRVTARIDGGEAVLGAGKVPGTSFVKAGAVPAVELVIANGADAAGEARFHVELQRSSARDAMRRVPMPSPPAWSDDYDLSLKAGEKRTIVLTFEKIRAETGDTLTLAVGAKPKAAAANPEARNAVVVARMDPSTSVRLVSMVVSPLPQSVAIENGGAVAAR
jgi:hypothetical protein